MLKPMRLVLRFPVSIVAQICDQIVLAHNFCILFWHQSTMSALVYIVQVFPMLFGYRNGHISQLACLRNGKDLACYSSDSPKKQVGQMVAYYLTYKNSRHKGC